MTSPKQGVFSTLALALKFFILFLLKVLRVQKPLSGLREARAHKGSAFFLQRWTHGFCNSSAVSTFFFHRKLVFVQSLFTCKYFLCIHHLLVVCFSPPVSSFFLFLFHTLFVSSLRTFFFSNFLFTCKCSFVSSSPANSFFLFLLTCTYFFKRFLPSELFLIYFHL